jgi:MoxR-like ATPase
VPARISGYRQDPGLVALLDAVAADPARLALWVHGPAGCGKSTGVEQWAAEHGRPFARLIMEADAVAADLIGGWALDPDRGQVWRDGALLQAIRTPRAIILLDEYTHAAPGVRSALQGLTDSSRAITVRETGEVVRLAPGAMLVAADNTAGTGDRTGAYIEAQPVGLQVRDRWIFHGAGYLAPAAEAAAVVAATGAPLELVRRLVAVAGAVRGAAQAGTAAEPMTMRAVLDTARLIALGVPQAAAVAAAMVGRCRPEDREILAAALAVEGVAQ